MAQRPDNICQLKKNLFVGTQKDFVETFNWVAQTVANMEGGTNCTIEWPMPDHPVINAQIAEDYDGYKEFNEDSGGGSGDITINGTEGSSETGNDFTFQSGSDSNVTVEMGTGGTMTFHVYYV